MTFRRGARLDPSQVRDLRGRGVRGGGAVAAGGGGIGLIVLLLYLFLGGGNGGGPSGGGAGGLDDLLDTTVGEGASPGAGVSDCRTAEDANTKDDCRIVGYVNSIQAYWVDEFNDSQLRYEQSQTTFFDGQVETGCGLASSQTGPFYCPADQFVYIDLGFFEVLKTSFGASGGPFAQAYVIAHEYGHHVQNLLGALQPGGGTGAESRAVRIELQADCYAGVWAANAVDTGYLEPLTREQIRDALDAAAAVGDDRIQRATQGRVDPESWTHGSSEQRQEWFTIGYESGNPDDCDTFDAEL